MLDWTATYNARQCTATEAIQNIQSGSRLFMTGNCSVPQVLLKTLCEQAERLKNVELVQILTVADNLYIQPEMQCHLCVNTMFVCNNTREAVNNGRADYTPIHLSEIPGLFRSGVYPID